jgi:hypothetical protein
MLALADFSCGHWQEVCKGDTCHPPIEPRATLATTKGQTEQSTTFNLYKARKLTRKYSKQILIGQIVWKTYTKLTMYAQNSGETLQAL